MYFAVVAKSGRQEEKEEAEKKKDEDTLVDEKQTSIWVYTSENHGTSIEVPLTPETTVLDVLDCVRDPVRGEGYLVAVAGDTEYILQEGDNAFTFLYEIWNTSGSPLTFLLRYCNQQAEWPPPELEARRHQMRKPQKEVSSGDMGKLPGGAGDLTLAELQEMASRQQQQMEAQQQVLVAKEQRLKYLKQQEARHAQLASESERLRKIRERVESQELKLKKLRALRGQAEQYRANNGNLNTELDAVKAVFNEKEKELAMAVARVDQLTRQLQDLRNGVNNGISGNKQAAAAAELEKLRKELLIRNKLNEQQSNTISAKEKVLNQRREEVARMDARIYELQQRLRKRRSQEQQIADQNQGNKINNARSGNQQSVNNNVATVEPYIQYAPNDVVKDDSFSKSGGFTKQDPKYQTLPSNVKFISQNKPGEDLRIGKQQEMNNNTELIEEYKLPTVLPMDNKLQRNLPNYYPPNQQQQHFHAEKDNAGKAGQQTNRQQAVSTVQSNTVNQNVNKPIKTDPTQGTVAKPLAPGSKFLPPTSVRSNSGTAPPQRPHVSLIGAGDGAGRGPGMLSPSAAPSAHPIININEEERQAGSGQSSPASSEASSNSSGGIRIKGDNEVNTSPIGPVSAMIEKLNKGTGQSQPATVPPTANQSRSNFTQRARQPSHEGNSTNVSVTKVRQASETSPQPQDEVDSSRIPPSTSSSNGSIQASQPSNSAPHLNQKPAPTYRYASKNQIANTYMGRLGGAAMEKYQRNLNMLYKNMDSQGFKPGSVKVAEGKTSFNESQESGPPLTDQGHLQFGAVSSPNYPDIASDKGSYKLNTPKHVRRRHSDSENEEMNKALQERQDIELKQQQPASTPAVEDKINTKTDSTSQPADKSKAQEKDRNMKTPQQSVADKPAEPSSAVASNVQKEEKKNSSQSATSKSKQKVEAVLKRTKSNLKKEGSKKNGNRVSFDPLALLLDASLEGELDLVKKVAVQVDDVSTPNDEGITALHNAICAGHYEIVKFLVEFGCDVNSPDSDGWTPLHCAASCNNLPMVRFLVEHGACVFATTISDHETAADKCEEEEDGYDGCSDYLYSIQEKLGITNNGEVYGVFDYQATQTDELSFVIGDKMTVLRKGDEKEKEWWWARLNGKEGYIPRNLLGLYPRVIQRPKEVSEC